MTLLPAADAAVAVLRRLGVATVFGIPGGQTIALMDAIYRDGAIRFVTTRHEGVAACAADAFGRLTGIPGVALATAGPGATNMLTGVGGAFRDSSPSIFIICDNRSEHLGTDDTQAADHVAIFRPLTKWATLVTDAKQIPSCLQEAYRVAVEGCPGPVLLAISRDVLEEGLVPSELVDAVEPWVVERPAPSAESILAARDLILSSRRPLIWAGRGAVISAAHHEILELAAEIAAPVVTTFNGIGAVLTTDPLVLGPLSRSGTKIASAALAESDLLIAIGNSLNGVSTGHWSLQLPPIVQIDIDPSAMGRAYPVGAAVVGDAKAACVALLHEIRQAGPMKLRSVRNRWGRGLRERTDQWRTEAFSEEGYDGGVPAPSLIEKLRELTPDDAIFCVDAGNPGIWTHLLEIRRPRTYMKPVGFGNMGFSLGAAIAAKIAEPTKTVVVVIGDGSLGMTLGDLETLAREHIDVTVLVMNNSSFGNIRQEQLFKLGAPRYIGVDLSPTDYAAVGRALGVDGTRVESVDELEAAMTVGLTGGHPYLIDVLISERNVWFKPF